jgi:RNA polymerase sigma factor (sigma-70 family)
MSWGQEFEQHYHMACCLAVALLKRYRIPECHCGCQDICQIAAMALRKALEQYDRERKADLTPYLRTRVWRLMIDELRRLRIMHRPTDCIPRLVSIDARRVRMRCRREGTPATQERDTLWQEVMAAVDQLEPRARQIVYERIEDRTEKEIAHREGLSDRRISQIWLRGLKQLRKKLRGGVGRPRRATSTP